MLPESLRTALGTVIAQCRREWQREHELIGAQAREVMAQTREVVADYRARIVELDVSARDQVTARLSTIRDGSDGAAGRDGVHGAPGRDGVDGKDGAPGRDGVDGAPGRDGVDGRSGRDGVDGKDAIPGRDGADGSPGQDGADGVPGRDGVDGRDGIPGRDGADGVAGRDSVDGAPGRDGIDGKVGPPGRDGIDGVPGRDGADGAPGHDGADGKDGAPGRDGADGAPGKLSPCVGWIPGVHYDGEVRTFAGATWQAARDTAETPGEGDDWMLLAAAGRDGISPRFVGTFGPDATYVRHDVVALNAGSFVALADAPGPCPGPGWQLVAGPGRRGAAGMDGKDGKPGAPGPSIAAWRVDVEAYAVTPVLTDGSTGPALDLRDLLERFRSELGV